MRFGTHRRMITALCAGLGVLALVAGPAMAADSTPPTSPSTADVEIGTAMVITADGTVTES